MRAMYPQTSSNLASNQKLGFEHLAGNAHLVHQGWVAAQFSHADVSKKERSMTEPERDLAHEADMRELMRQQLRDNITPEEAAEECAEIEPRAACMEGADLDDGADLLGDPDEYDEEDFVCERCRDDGRDPYSDYLLPCPVCQREQTP